jgi:hypothetical protein
MSEKNLEQLNLLPINHLAANKLRAAGVKTDPAILTVFQLMLWGLEDGIPLTHRRAAAELERLSRDPDPAGVLEYLFANVPGGMAEVYHFMGRLPARAAAQMLLDVLDMRLKADPRDPYPCKEPEKQ